MLKARGFWAAVAWFFVLSLTLTGCFQQAPKGDGSVLILVIPNFRSDDLGCGSSPDSFTPQLDSICNESVRFTHAYTSSVLAVPALASILTGLYPAEHGVHRNDASVYVGGVKALPQWAREKGLETFLVSGGVPVLRKTAVARGFTDFDDSVRIDGSYYRPAMESVKKFLSLVENRSDGASFLGVITFADLEFPEIATGSESAPRGETYNGKIQEVDEAVGFLRSVFRMQKIWDRMTVVVVGTNGSERTEHDGLSKGLNLYDEVIHIPLMIKPSRKPRDQGPSWKVDEPVNLVDLGATLMNIIGAGDAKKSAYPTVEFSGALSGKNMDSRRRPLFVESDLPSWRRWGPRLVLMRFGEWAYWLPPEEKLFNTYTDHMELRNLYSLDYVTFNLLNSVWSLYSAGTGENPADLAPGTPKFIPASIEEKLRAVKTFFSDNSQTPEVLAALRDLEMRRPDDWQLIQWHVRVLVETGGWPALHELLSKVHPRDTQQKAELGLWELFLHLKFHTKVRPAAVAASNCLYLAASLKRFSLAELESFQSQQTCPDHETHDWVSAFIQFKLKQMKDAVAYFDMARAQTEKREDQIQFAKYFWLEGDVWDYDVALPGGPSVFELFTTLASNQDFLEFIKKKQIP